MGSLSIQTPSTISRILIANLALCGSPFLAGFYSKDIILEISTFNINNTIILILLFLSTSLTAAYSIRFLLSVALSPSLSSPLHFTHDSDLNITIPASIITFGAIAGGAILNWIAFIPMQEPFLSFPIKIIALARTAAGVLTS